MSAHALKIPARAFVLIRHGETTANRDGIIAGRLDVPLTEKGRAQARALAGQAYPQPVAVFTSPMDRARETATLAFPEVPARVFAGFRERDWGRFEGRPLAELPPRDTTPEGGEGWAAMQQRVAAALAACMAEAGPRLPVIICHSGVIRAARLLTGQPDAGTRPPNALPVFFRPLGDTHEEIHHAA